MEPLLDAWGGPLGEAGSVRMHLSIFAMSLWGEREQGERLLSIISTKEQTEGKYEADRVQKFRKIKSVSTQLQKK